MDSPQMQGSQGSWLQILSKKSDISFCTLCISEMLAFCIKHTK